MNRNDSKQDERHQGASQEAIRPHDRPEADADLPSWHAIADLCIADTEALAITARDRLEAVTAHVRFLSTHATHATRAARGTHSVSVPCTSATNSKTLMHVRNENGCNHTSFGVYVFRTGDVRW